MSVRLLMKANLLRQTPKRESEMDKMSWERSLLKVKSSAPKGDFKGQAKHSLKPLFWL